MFPLFVAALCLLPVALGAQERFKDRIWLWCHVAGAHNDGSSRFYNDLRRQEPTIGLVPRTANRYRFNHPFAVTPAQAAAELGIENVIMVKYNIGPNPGPAKGTFASCYAENQMDQFKKVIWSLVGEGGTTSPGELRETLELAGARTNLCGFVMDDFFVRAKEQRPLTPVRIRALQRHIRTTLPGRVHGRLWVVLYDTDIRGPGFYKRFAPWLQEVDGITLWFKGQRPLTETQMEKTLARLEWLIARFPRPPEILLGCYMWRYLERTRGEINPKRMDTQLSFASRHMESGRLAGVIFLGSPIVQVTDDAPARNNVLAVKNWISAHGERRISDSAASR